MVLAEAAEISMPVLLRSVVHGVEILRHLVGFLQLGMLPNEGAWPVDLDRDELGARRNFTARIALATGSGVITAESMTPMGVRY